MIAEVPEETAATTPDELPTVATEVVPLVHVPPDVLLVSIALPPVHAERVPPIAAGTALTV